ncbi:MAG: hypothetical protein CMF62_02330 [Magnetococcales bacterium]|nr:hypothetical protein [Magnetococcales bacterium]|tara:strand:- start:8019 stop:8348 length:330 start_codon:yes stop_codon:yes gene_type:complete
MHNYQLTYPFEGDKVYQSKSKKRAFNKCYKDFKHLNDTKDGVFTITDIDTKKDYSFKIKDKKVSKFNFDQSGGKITKEMEEIIDRKIDEKFQKMLEKFQKMFESKKDNK